MIIKSKKTKLEHEIDIHTWTKIKEVGRDKRYIVIDTSPLHSVKRDIEVPDFVIEMKKHENKRIDAGVPAKDAEPEQRTTGKLLGKQRGRGVKERSLGLPDKLELGENPEDQKGDADEVI